MLALWQTISLTNHRFQGTSLGACVVSGWFGGDYGTMPQLPITIITRTSNPDLTLWTEDDWYKTEDQLRTRCGLQMHIYIDRHTD